MTRVLSANSMIGSHGLFCRATEPVLSPLHYVTKKYSIYDGFDLPDLLMELDGSERVTMTALHGAAVDRVLAEELTDYSSSGVATKHLQWPLEDQVGTASAIATSGASGTAPAVSSEILRNAFGSVIAIPGLAGSPHSEFGFDGQTEDSATKLTGSRDRPYSSQQLRFIAQDPIRLASGQTNFYQIVGNKPNTATDPSGLAEDGSSTVRSCIVCHNPVMMYGSIDQKIRYLEENPEVARGIMEATKARSHDEILGTLDGMHSGASAARSVVVAGGFVATAPVSLPLAVAGTVFGAGLEYSASGDTGKAIDNIPGVSMRHVPEQIGVLLNEDSSDSEKAFASFGLATNVITAVPLAKASGAFFSRLELQGGALTQTSMSGPLNQLRLKTTASDYVELTKNAKGKGNNFTVKTQKEAEEILQAARPGIPWNETYAPKSTIGEEPSS